MSHTPGPWSIKRIESAGALVYALIIGHPQTANLRKPSGVAFAGTYMKDKRSVDRTVTRITESECMANARLIAAAPDLLAALEDCAKWAQSRSGMPEDDDAAFEAIGINCRAAIARAKGQA